MVMVTAMQGSSQIYVLKDHRDTVIPNPLFDTLPELCDSFFSAFVREDKNCIKRFVPDLKFLLSTYDSMDLEVNEANALYRQQHVQKNLELQYRKLLKKAKKEKLNIKKLGLDKKKLDYGIDDKGNEFCFVSLHCSKNRKKFVLKFTAIKLNSIWFMGDDLLLQRE